MRNERETSIPLPFATRRGFLRACGAAATGVLGVVRGEGPPAAGETYETQAKGLRVLPGAWRPHYPFEHIAWVSPSWPSQDYLWLDFPEAIFAGRRLHYLSHINPAVPSEYTDLPRVPWEETPRGIRFERTLPNGIAFGGSLVKENESTVEMQLHIDNGSDGPLEEITLQTCVFLRAIREFADYTRDNKYVHHPERGWITLTEARALEAGAGPYRVGWRTRGTPLAELPVIVTVSNAAARLVAMTWHADTLSMVSNPNHPCMHADPKFPDLAQGESATITGRLHFFEGPLADFDPRPLLER